MADQNHNQQEVADRLSEVAIALNAIRTLAQQAASTTDADLRGCYLTAIAETARANVNGIDACIERLTGERQGHALAEFDQE